jgi:MOSC domain-containing protein YiiM
MMGTVEGIYITSMASTPMQSVTSAVVVAGKGLEGDRYAAGVGFYSPNPTTEGARELTLIEQESIEAVREEGGIDFADIETRRNIVTRGVRLGDLLGKRFTIGEVVCEGVRDCPPCVHLDELTGKRVMPLLVHTGGLRARIVSGGAIAIGDRIVAIGLSKGPTHPEGDA